MSTPVHLCKSPGIKQHEGQTRGQTGDQKGGQTKGRQKKLVVTNMLD